MSFELRLHVARLTPEQARVVEGRCRAQAAWPVQARAVRRGVLRRLTDWVLHMPAEVSGEDLLSDDAEWDADAWRLQPHLLTPLATAVRVLGCELPQGFTFSAAWTGSAAQTDIVLSAEDLAAVVMASGLREHVAYRVPPR